jgi:hypothetical protein
MGGNEFAGVPVSGGTADWRIPSMNAANTNSAFDGHCHVD